MGAIGVGSIWCFVVVFSFGLLLYFGYGYRHSKLRQSAVMVIHPEASPEEPEIYVPPPELSTTTKNES
jgi:hypothetical protein